MYFNIYLLTCSSITLLNGSWCGRVGGDVMEDKLLYRELQSPAVTALLLESRMDCAEVFIDKVGFNRFQFIKLIKTDCLSNHLLSLALSPLSLHFNR